MTKLTDAFQLRPWTLEDKGKHFFKENQRINRIEEDDDIQDYKKPWVGLTDEERLRVLQFIDPKTVRLPLGFKQIAESIERLLKEKNA